jgi:excisionase family DNA binding protein
MPVIRRPAPRPRVAAYTKTPSTTIIILESPRLYLNIEEAAQYLRVSRRTIYTLMEKKQVTYTRVREGLRFRLQWLNEYLDKRTVVAA